MITRTKGKRGNRPADAKSVSRKRSNPAEKTAECEVVLTRVINAPRKQVFKAWTDAQQMQQWWGPRGFTNPVCEIDARPGGALHIVMRGPAGVEYPMTGVFREILEPERLVFNVIARNKEDNPLLESLTTVTFAEHGDQTELTVQASAVGLDPVAPQMLAGMEAGWRQSLDRLEELVTKMTSAPRAFVITRVFDAPPELVFRAWTEQEHMRWWGPRGVAITQRKLDLRPGGVFHYCMRTPDGHEIWGKWAIREIVKPERLVFVTSFSDEAGGITRHPMSPHWPLEMLSTVMFVEHDGKTMLSVQWLPLNPTELERKTFDEGYESMFTGWTGTLDRLAEHLATV